MKSGFSFILMSFWLTLINILMIATFKKAETATKLSLILTILFNSVNSEKIHKVKCYLLNSMYTYMTYHDIQKQKTKNVAWIMAVLQVAVIISGYWWLLNYRGRGWGLFFEKLEKIRKKLEKKQNCQQGESNPGFLCERQVSLPLDHEISY